MNHIVVINNAETYIIPESRIYELRRWLQDNTAKHEAARPGLDGRSLLNEKNVYGN